MLRSSLAQSWKLPAWPSTPRCIGDIGNENLRQPHFDDGNHSQRETKMKSTGNLILITLVCLIIFWVFMAIRPAAAKVDRACVRGEVGKMFDRKQAKRLCNPVNYVKPPRLGWRCKTGGERDGDLVTLTLGPGGAKRKRDAICE
jgi:hypothetical protein